jgi:tRNA (cmo5U34)-methyltransferase
MLLVMHFLPDDGAKLELLRSVAARLKPGAPLIVADMHGDLKDPAVKRRYEAWQRRQIARGVAVSDAEAMFKGLPQVVHFVRRELIEELLREAGFVEIEPVFNAFVIGEWFARRGPDG